MKKHSPLASKIMLFNLLLGLILFSVVLLWLKSEKGTPRPKIDLKLAMIQSLSDPSEPMALNTDKPYLFVNFWASWCEICKKETEVLKAVEEALPASLVQQFGIASFDNLEKASASEKVKALKMTFALDKEGKTSALFNVNGLPHSFLLDQEGNIMYAVKGPLNQGDVVAIKDLVGRRHRELMH